MSIYQLKRRFVFADGKQPFLMCSQKLQMLLLLLWLWLLCTRTAHTPTVVLAVVLQQYNPTITALSALRVCRPSVSSSWCNWKRVLI